LFRNASPPPRADSCQRNSLTKKTVDHNRNGRRNAYRRGAVRGYCSGRSGNGHGRAYARGARTGYRAGRRYPPRYDEDSEDEEYKVAAE
jgi:hypothetical protein